jgi:LysR family hydrogen peroxide-inducible transcriptional activator
MDVTLRQLEYAAAVARLGHFGRAAEACHATQPALSAGISQLERALGVRLFERGRRGARPTAAAAGILHRVAEVLARVEDLREAARTGREPFTAPLRLGAIPTIAPFVLPRAVPALRAHWPRLRLVLLEDRTDALVRGVEEGKLDAALVARETELGSCETIPLYRDPFYAAVPAGHRLAAGRTVDVGRLRKEQMLLLEDGH